MATRKRTTKKSTRTRSRPRYARSQRQLANALGRSQPAIAYWTKRPDWPFGRPIKWPLKISAVRAWVDATLTKDASDVGADHNPVDIDDDGIAAIKRQIVALDPLKKAKLRKLLAETQQIKRKNQILDQWYMERAKARAEIASIIHNTTTGILAEARSSADAIHSLGVLVDGGKKRVAKLLIERAEALCNRFADSMNGVVDNTE